jgi:zinc transporter
VDLGEHGRGGGETCGAEHLRSGAADDRILWLHFDRKHPTTREWITREAGLPGIVAEALLTEDTRPRADVHGPGAIIILRGVNLNPGSQPDELISIRMWVEPRRIITLRFPRFQTIADIRQAVDEGRGPATAGQFVVAVAQGLTERLQPALENLADQIDQIEEQSLEDESGALRFTLLSLRRQAIALRRYLGPQREALQHLRDTPQGWLEDADRLALREITDRTTRNVEDLDALRDRAALMREELMSRQTDRMNRTMYVLSMVATIFLPLGLITGLLGINVGGLPGTESPVAFFWVCVLLVALAVAGFAFVRWKKLL